MCCQVSELFPLLLAWWSHWPRHAREIQTTSGSHLHQEIPSTSHEDSGQIVKSLSTFSSNYCSSSSSFSWCNHPNAAVSYDYRFNRFSDFRMFPVKSRGIERFNEIDANSTPVLFVRTIPTTQELVKVPELLGDTKAKPKVQWGWWNEKAGDHKDYQWIFLFSYFDGISCHNGHGINTYIDILNLFWCKAKVDGFADRAAWEVTWNRLSGNASQAKSGRKLMASGMNNLNNLISMPFYTPMQSSTFSTCCFEFSWAWPAPKPSQHP